jgi:hypothetical protein
MKSQNNVTKIIVVSAFVIVLIFGLGFIKNRMVGFFGGTEVNGGDLVIVNDTSETASSAFMRDGKMMSKVMHAGEKTSGGRGLIRIFVAKKSGAYEIEYPFPRPVGKPFEIGLTQIFAAVSNPKMGEELITEKGMIDDIRVDYEEVRNLDATY